MFTRFVIVGVCAGLLLAGCSQKAPKPEPAVAAVTSGSGSWQASVLSEQAQEKVLAQVRVYQQCINQETQKHVNDQGDSRRITDLILKNCEGQLSMVKTILINEKVPEQNADLYIRSKGSRAAQQVVREVMGTQAMRSVNP